MAIPGTLGKSVAPGSWLAASQINLRMQVQSNGGLLTPEVEIQPVDAPFTGQANYSGPPVSKSGLALVVVESLSNGTSYHWQARVSDAKGAGSTWTVFDRTGRSPRDFGVDQSPPSRPTIRSATNSDQRRWYHTSVEELSWTSRDTISGVAGYSYVLERKAHVIPPGAIDSHSFLKLSGLSDGVWFLALRAIDRAGNWSPTATFRLQLDRRPPQIRWLSPPRITLNPYRGPASVRFTVTKDASVTLGLYRVGSREPVEMYSYAPLRAGKVITIVWTGEDRKGRPLSRGYYFFSAMAVDRASNIVHLDVGGILLDPSRPLTSPSGQVLYPDGGKRIIVSLSREMLYAFEGVKLVEQTVVTTGNPNLPTPPGNYSVLAKYHPFEFVSPWPSGSPYWYPPSLSQYAMLFRDGGYFLHDAPWRSAFGPGTDGAGQPGTNYGGTHGCVNIPPAPAVQLYNWADIGTPVQVVP
jgi:L,D-transpeptidase catalytic domain